MTSVFCNQILLFQDVDFDLPTVLKSMEPYMFIRDSQPNETESTDSPPKCIQEKQEQDQPITAAPVDLKPIKSIIIKTITKTIPIWHSPKQVDSLFWCLYICHHGYNNYVSDITRNSGVKELEIKQTIVEQMKTNKIKFAFPNYKITKACVQEIMSELLTVQNKTTLYCLLAILAFFKINMVMLDNSETFVLEFITDATISAGTTGQPTMWVFKSNKQHRFSVRETPLTQDEYAQLKTSKIHLVNYLKPLNAITSYKMKDLEELAVRLNIYDTSRKYKKNELYELLIHEMMISKLFRL